MLEEKQEEVVRVSPVEIGLRVGGCAGCREGNASLGGSLLGARSLQGTCTTIVEITRRTRRNYTPAGLSTSDFGFRTSDFRPAGLCNLWLKRFSALGIGA